MEARQCDFSLSADKKAWGLEIGVHVAVSRTGSWTSLNAYIPLYFNKLFQFLKNYIILFPRAFADIALDFTTVWPAASGICDADEQEKAAGQSQQTILTNYRIDQRDESYR